MYTLPTRTRKHLRTQPILQIPVRKGRFSIKEVQHHERNYYRGSNE
jgi:hypothetical protein